MTSPHANLFGPGQLATSFRHFLAVPDPLDFLCDGGVQYDCRMNKWGDKILGCDPYCGLPPFLPLVWTHRMRFGPFQMMTKCKFEAVHPLDYGKGKQGVDLENLGGGKKKGILGMMDDSPTWYGWYAREDYPVDNVSEAEVMNVNPMYDVVRLCCDKPTRKCINIHSRNVALHMAPIPVEPTEMAQLRFPPCTNVRLQTFSRGGAGQKRGVERKRERNGGSMCAGVFAPRLTIVESASLVTVSPSSRASEHSQWIRAVWGERNAGRGRRATFF